MNPNYHCRNCGGDLGFTVRWWNRCQICRAWWPHDRKDARTKAHGAHIEATYGITAGAALGSYIRWWNRCPVCKAWWPHDRKDWRRHDQG